MTTENYFQTRLVHDPRREILWKTLCDSYFSRLVRPGGTVLELGAGYGHFINNIRAARKVAVDQWEGFLAYLNPDVEGHVGTVDDLTFVEEKSIDFVFASNLFEHVSQETLASVLGQLKKKLRPGGSLVILQPNYYYAYREYFDDYTHVTVYSHVSLSDFLMAHDFQVREAYPRFLPLTVKSRWPVSPLMIRLYLWSPIKLFGKQMLLLAEPAG